jgi:hypothetical protein
MHLATPLIQARTWRSEDTHAPASFAGINDIYGSSRFRGHPKTSSVPFCTKDIRGPGGTGRHNRFLRFMQPSEEGRKNLRYLMHLPTPLIQARTWRSEDNHAPASFAGINNIHGSSKFRRHPKTSPVPLCTKDIKSPGGIGRHNRFL